MSSSRAPLAGTGRTSQSTWRTGSATSIWRTSGTMPMSGDFVVFHSLPCQVLSHHLQVWGARGVSRLERAGHRDRRPGYRAHPYSISGLSSWLRSHGSRPSQRGHSSLHQEPRAICLWCVQGSPRLGRPQDSGVHRHPALHQGHRGGHLPLWRHFGAD